MSDALKFFTIGTACVDYGITTHDLARLFNAEKGVFDAKAYIEPDSDYEDVGGSAVNTRLALEGTARAFGHNAVVYACTTFGRSGPQNLLKDTVLNALGVNTFGDPTVLDIYYNQDFRVKRNPVIQNYNGEYSGRIAFSHKKPSVDQSPTIRQEIADVIPHMNGVMLHSRYYSLAAHAARIAEERNIPVLLDWCEESTTMATDATDVIRHSKYVVAPGNALLPGMAKADARELLERFVEQYGCENVAVSDGGDPVQYFTNGQYGAFEVRRPHTISTTVGAGDARGSTSILSLALGHNFLDALKAGSEVATISIEHRGREWIPRMYNEARANALLMRTLQPAGEQAQALVYEPLAS